MVERQDFIVRFAGEGGQGVVTAAEALARIAAEVGYHAQTFATFPSQILGGPTWTQTRISTVPVLSAGDGLDVLVALNYEAYASHQHEVWQNGIVLYDSSFEPNHTGRSLGMPFDELAKEAGDIRTANMVMMGALAYLVNMPEEYLKDFIVRRFQARGDAIVQANMKAISLGRDRTASGDFQIGALAPPNKPNYEQVLLKGNEALSLGAIAAGLDSYIGYPISPATPILLFMERNLVGPGKFAYQASSEIESISSVVGAGYTGKKAMTATSGPGFSLMGEGIGLAWMAEIPVVVIDVQRGGPATGLPTKTEQSDLFTALTPAHGDVMLPVIAPGTVEECFYGIITAINWAERYQGPVVLLSEMALAERAENIQKPDLSEIAVENREVYDGINGYQRYDSSELSPMPIPGNPGAYIANGSEHDAIGDTTHLANRHVQMTERRFGKLKLLEDGTYESCNQHESIAVMAWGGSKGPVLEAYNKLIEQGQHIGWYYTMYLHPLPPALLKELKDKDLVIVPELNYQGQFSSVLRSYGVRAESITQYTGLPFKVRDLITSITKRVEDCEKKVIKV
ncbi:2-oxoacid:acceptor oxidoreductase subunit alpha [Dehalococcoidia bacterium]|nr:2-oxoacid:acceptor oxidoreductase subunit alpha [Dehalococcoidia bacterium]